MTPGTGACASGPSARPGPRQLGALFLLATLLTGCQAGYVLDLGFRQLGMARRQVPLDSPTVRDAIGTERLKKLDWVPRILAFARDELGLDPGSSYTTFLDTGNQPISYVVTAASPYALRPYQWRFPFAGQVSYKGYFEKEDARRERDRLEGEGFDTRVSPVQAFSTLGWFRDPVLSTMLDGEIHDLVELLLHECVHRTIYFHGPSSEATTVNESLATHVAFEGTLLFLELHPELTELRQDFLASKALRGGSRSILERLRQDLNGLYGSGRPTRELEAEKQRLFQRAARARNYLYAGEGRVELPATNAVLLASAAYDEFVPLFQRLQAQVGETPKDLILYLKAAPRDENPVAAFVEDKVAIDSASAPPPSEPVNPPEGP